MCLNLYPYRVLKYQNNMERIKKQMDTKLKFCKNEVYSSYDPITQTRLVQFGWKKEL
jgi:hypothetical protein